MFFFLTYLTIYFLSVRKVPFCVVCLVNQVVATECLKKKKKKHTKVLLNLACLRASLSWKIHKNGCGLFFWGSNLIIKCYKGHLEQPHSRAVSISSEYEVPSVQRKNTFLLLLLVTPQQTPVGAAAWQDRGQSMRGILLVDVHVLSGWCRFSCSLTISPWHVNSGHEIRQMFTDFNGIF